MSWKKIGLGALRLGGGVLGTVLSGGNPLVGAAVGAGLGAIGNGRPRLGNIAKGAALGAMGGGAAQGVRGALAAGAGAKGATLGALKGAVGMAGAPEAATTTASNTLSVGGRTLPVSLSASLPMPNAPGALASGNALGKLGAFARANPLAAVQGANLAGSLVAGEVDSRRAMRQADADRSLAARRLAMDEEDRAARRASADALLPFLLGMSGRRPSATTPVPLSSLGG